MVVSASRRCLTMSQVWSTGTLVKRDSTLKLTSVSVRWDGGIRDGIHGVLGVGDVVFRLPYEGL